VYVHLRRLRKKLEENPSQPRRIITIRGVGYKLELVAI
jgi:DNA-binding response OmpR family regulator